MGRPAARQGDPVTGTDVHVLLVPSPTGPVPTPTPMPFAGSLTGGTSPDVRIEGRPAAVVGSTARNDPPHVAPSPFQVPPGNQGQVVSGSASVFVNGKPLARAGDRVASCTDLPWPAQPVIAAGAATVSAS